MTCPTCLKLQLVTYDTPGGARARPCPSCVGTCTVCRGTGYVYRTDDAGYTFAVPCSCRAVERKVDLFNAIGLPGRFHNAKLVNFDERVEDHHTIIDYLDSWLREYRPGAEGILFCGATGVGKTHLLCALLRQLTLHQGIPTRFIDFFQLLARIREAYSDGRSEMDLLGPLMETPVLAIDELGKGKSGEWERGVLDQLISHRYNQELTTLFTTNHPLQAETSDRSLGNRLVLRSPEDLEKLLGTAPLEERVGVRIYSRIREMCRPILLQGAEDIRLSQFAMDPLGGGS